MQGCPNTCEIRQVKIDGEKPLFYGSRCEKYEVGEAQKQYDLPDLVKEREDLLYGSETPPGRQAGRHRHSPHHVLPGTHALLPRLLRGPGLHRGLLPEDQQAGDSPGRGGLAAEPCYPVKVAHGHILDLLKAGVKRIFLPSVIDMPHPHPEIGSGVVCPMAQSLAYTAPTAIDFAAYGAKVLSPVLYFGRGDKGSAPGPAGPGERPGGFGLPVNRALRRALAAQQAYYDASAPGAGRSWPPCRPTAGSWS